MATLLGVLMLVVAIFLILVVLIQRGRGGGLAGAFGGMGGQSAFGTRAGDVMTRVTIVVASIWIALCMLTTCTLTRQPSRFEQGAEAGQTPAGTSESPGPAAPQPSSGPEEKAKP